ncbi:hypothetical protein A3J77_00605 [Candidatus Wolfebacteria bacterium RBG_13_41_7]|uniref:Methyltransferase domain-containing protein n=1 Tax=Candidatus Wolfebacteria bacterium RBG_13_41_7 TaxID=1802554 RepID=A0A1F8DMH5_9BACT|nr:MAG: hypothetical protein A3J77_00605 [Candidatus Wolfebacteria bacterium RBG_13_41_7]
MYQGITGNKLLDANIVLTKAQVGPKMKVGELGCGSNGHFVFPASKLVGREGIVYAVDILKVALDSIRRRSLAENVKNVRTVWSDLEVFNATTIASGSLDVALLINTLHQSKKRIDVLREAMRMLKRNGRLVIVEWKNIASPFGPPEEDRVNLENLKIAAEKIGLKLDEEFFVGHYHFGLIFYKL